jgi:hypothetical protein
MGVIGEMKREVDLRNGSDVYRKSTVQPAASM